MKPGAFKLWVNCIQLGTAPTAACAPGASSGAISNSSRISAESIPGIPGSVGIGTSP
jgi:hypothetical protein